MTKNSKNVQKLDNMIKRIKTAFPSLKFKATQKTTETSARGWGIRVDRSHTETSLEPFKENSDERG